MSKKHTSGLFLTLGLAFALSACGGSSAATTQTVTMMAIGSSGQSGTATLIDLGNNTTSVSINTSGGTDTGSQPAHIHTGVCGSNGPVFAALTNVQNGGSATTVPDALSTLEGGNHYINIHLSTDATLATIEACGQIK